MEFCQGKRFGERFKVTASLGHVSDGVLLLARDKALSDIEVGLRLWKKGTDPELIRSLFELCCSERTPALPQAIELLELDDGPAITYPPPPQETVAELVERIRLPLAGVAWILYQLLQGFEVLCNARLSFQGLTTDRVRIGSDLRVQLSLFECEGRFDSQALPPFRDLGQFTSNLLECSLTAPFEELCLGCSRESLEERWHSPKPGEVLISVTQRLLDEVPKALCTTELLSELHFVLYELNTLSKHPKPRNLHP